MSKRVYGQHNSVADRKFAAALEDDDSPRFGRFRRRPLANLGNRSAAAAAVADVSSDRSTYYSVNDESSISPEVKPRKMPSISFDPSLQSESPTDNSRLDASNEIRSPRSSTESNDFYTSFKSDTSLEVVSKFPARRADSDNENASPIFHTRKSRRQMVMPRNSETTSGKNVTSSSIILDEIKDSIELSSLPSKSRRTSRRAAKMGKSHVELDDENSLISVNKRVSRSKTSDAGIGEILDSKESNDSMSTLSNEQPAIELTANTEDELGIKDISGTNELNKCNSNDPELISGRETRSRVSESSDHLQQSIDQSRNFQSADCPIEEPGDMTDSVNQSRDFSPEVEEVDPDVSFKKAELLPEESSTTTNKDASSVACPAEVETVDQDISFKRHKSSSSDVFIATDESEKQDMLPKSPPRVLALKTPANSWRPTIAGTFGAQSLVSAFVSRTTDFLRKSLHLSRQSVAPVHLASQKVSEDAIVECEEVESRETSSRVETPRKSIAFHCCDQELQSFSRFESSLDPELLIEKIGEGSFSEVFKLFYPAGGSDERRRILKVMALREGFDEETVESEYQITSCLSSICPNFVHLYSCHYVTGAYPVPLLDAWWRFKHSSPEEAINECPSQLDPHQRFLILELGDAGEPFENYKFKKFNQAVSVVQQLACCLAMAESAVEFEHRDLHMSNVMLSPTRDKTYTYSVGGRPGQLKVHTNGIKLTVIDYTLSRLLLNNQLKFNDLSTEESSQLFEQDEEVHQFVVYREMRDVLENDWARFNPLTNILWMYHIMDKLLYFKPKTDFQVYDPDRREKIKKIYLALKDKKYTSCVDLVTNSNLLRI